MFGLVLMRVDAGITVSFLAIIVCRDSHSRYWHKLMFEASGNESLFSLYVAVISFLLKKWKSENYQNCHSKLKFDQLHVKERKKCERNRKREIFVCVSVCREGGRGNICLSSLPLLTR